MRDGVAFGLCMLVVGCADASADRRPQNGDDELRATKLEVVASARLPIREVSGLGHRRVATGTSHLAIGDASPTLVTFELTPSGGVASVTAHDLSGIFGAGAPQWEAVAGDGEGRVFVLAETTGTITVLDARLTRVLHTMETIIPRDHPLAHAWAEDEGSRAEGMVLLANGHVLVAKEKNPPALVELAPRGAAPEGYRPDLALGDRAFPLPPGKASELVATKHWLLKSNDERQLPDVSDLAVDAEGRLLLLSDQGRAIARIERQLDPTEDKIDVKAVFALPSKVAKPEGLAFAGEHPIVAIDMKDVDEPSLFEIAALP